MGICLTWRQHVGKLLPKLSKAYFLCSPFIILLTPTCSTGLLFLLSSKHSLSGVTYFIIPWNLERCLKYERVIGKSRNRKIMSIYCCSSSYQLSLLSYFEVYLLLHPFFLILFELLLLFNLLVMCIIIVTLFPLTVKC